jgi:dTDP-4-dehydrorhamnose 3,5-epimerase
MIFTETPLEGVFVIDVELHEDERGSFARTFCSAEFERRGLSLPISQCNVSYNTGRGTLRGMHYQAEPHGEAKLVRCTSGSIFDVVVDLRERSRTYCRWFAIELTARNRRMLYVPSGLAHGFQTLADESEVFYVMSAPYVPDAFRGVRFDDPAFAISWPEPVRVVSARDLAYVDFRP